jgi:outer membrane protein TolC
MSGGGRRARRQAVRGLVAIIIALLTAATVSAQPPAPMTQVTFDEAIRIALEKNPGVAQAAQAILRAEVLLQQARTVERPTVSATVTTTILDSERGFDDLVTQPQTQSFVGAAVSFPVLAASRWAARTQALDQVRVARLGVSDVRQQIAIATAQAYLAIIAQQRQVDVNLRARENAQAHVDYARRRLEGGLGSRLNELRASQELATDEVFLEGARLAMRRAQEALGALLAMDAPVDVAGEPAFEVPALPDGDGWLADRPDVQLSTAQVSAATRVYRDSWKEWVPSATASFEPQFVAPAGLFQPSRTWRGFLSFTIPVLDAGVRRATTRQREVAVESARIQLTDVELQARAQLRSARAAVESTERALAHARTAAQHAADVLRISDIAFREGLTSNIELVDAQRRARDADTAVAQAEDRVRQARLDLLVALGRFPQ